MKKLLDSLARLHDPENPNRTLDRLIAWLQQRPLISFCFVGEWLCDLRSKDRLPETWFNDVVFWIVQDWRNHYLQCRCPGCGPETAVPLARVWLWNRKDHRGKDHCTPIYISGYPPFRRPVATECWPAPSNSISLAPFVWQLKDASLLALRKLGFSDVSFQQFNAADPNSLRVLPENEMIFSSRRTI